MVTAASYPPLQKTQERGTHSFETGDEYKAERPGHPPGTCPASQSVVPLANNQLPPPYQYDIAGNMMNDGNHSYTYDAENRITQVDGGSTASYQYDAWGKRIRKTASAVGNLDYIYDTSGRVLAEWQSGNIYTGWNRNYVYMGGSLVGEYRGGTTYFRHEDHLGTASLETMVNQSVYNPIDFQPFGEQTSGGTGITHKFTGKERDAESAPAVNPLNGLDYFDARYYSPILGRFMKPDDGSDQHPSDPQSWNLYSYVRNNPLSNTDPTGRCSYAGGKYMQDAISDCSEVDDLSNPPAVTVSASSPSTFETWNDNSRWFANYALEQIVGNWLGSFMQAGRTKDPLVFTLSVLALINPIEGGGAGIEITEEGLEHIAERHVVGGALAATGKKSVFNAGEDVKALIKAAEDVKPQKMGGGDFARVVDAGRPIGVDRATGAPTSTYTVITNQSGKLVNAFPGKP